MRSRAMLCKVKEPSSLKDVKCPQSWQAPMPRRKQISRLAVTAFFPVTAFWKFKMNGFA
jgi:hypothetical protein